MKSIRRMALAGLVLAALATPAAAQQGSTVTQADVQRLQDNIYLADRDVQQARSRDSAQGFFQGAAVGRGLVPSAAVIIHESR